MHHYYHHRMKKNEKVIVKANGACINTMAII